jgi:hypothetical protein
LGGALPAFAAENVEVTGDVVVSNIDTGAYPQVALEVAPPRLLATRDLNAGAFTVTENDARRDAVVTRLPNESLQIAMVIDPAVSDGVFRDVQGAALDFLLRVPLGTRVALVSAGRDARVTLPSTLDLGAVTSAVGDLAPGQGRALHDAIRQADSQLPVETGTRRAVVVFAAGADTTSSGSLDAVERQLRTAGTRLYSVELATGNGGDALQSIVDGTGGQTIRTGTAELVGAYQRVADVLLNQYRVTFRASSRGRARLGIQIAADDISGASSLAVQVGAPAAANPAPATLEGGGGRAEPLAAGLTIVIALLAGGVLVFLGHAGLRGRAAKAALGRDGEDHDVVAV